MRSRRIRTSSAARPTPATTRSVALDATAHGPHVLARVVGLPARAPGWAGGSFSRSSTRQHRRVMRAGWYLLGEELSSFEAEFATYSGSRHCAGVASGLDASCSDFGRSELVRVTRSSFRPTPT